MAARLLRFRLKGEVRVRVRVRFTARVRARVGVRVRMRVRVAVRRRMTVAGCLPPLPCTLLRRVNPSPKPDLVGAEHRVRLARAGLAVAHDRVVVPLEHAAHLGRVRRLEDLARGSGSG